MSMVLNAKACIFVFEKYRINKIEIPKNALLLNDSAAI